MLVRKTILLKIKIQTIKKKHRLGFRLCSLFGFINEVISKTNQTLKSSYL